MDFEKELKRKVWQLRRSKLMQKKIEEEMGGGEWTKERAKEYIEKTIPQIAKEEYSSKPLPKNAKIVDSTKKT